MKRIKLFIIVLICLFVVNVKADMGPPIITTHDVVVVNKNGAQCYDYDGKKENKIIPYGTTLTVDQDIDGSFINVFKSNSGEEENEYSCRVKYVDISAKSQNFNMKDETVEKITPIKAVILAKAGVNLRKGPSVTYSKITTVPQYTVVTATYSSGDYWYYVTYNGKSGWITAMNGYIGFEGSNILTHYEPLEIYASDGKKVLGTIPANAEITNYLRLANRTDSQYYVVYNNIKGYVYNPGFKTDGSGKIKLTADYEVTADNGKVKQKIAKGTVLDYTIVYTNMKGEPGVYLPEKKMEVILGYDFQSTYIKEAKILKKTSGYIGEGWFGEKVTTKTNATTKPSDVDEPTQDITQEPSDVIAPVPNEDDNPKPNSMSTRDIIIICLLGGIFLALTAIVLIKLLDKKKTNTISYNKEESKSDDQPEKKEIKLEDELNRIKDDHNKEV